jgi:site-specific recombinase XerD
MNPADTKPDPTLEHPPAQVQPDPWRELLPLVDKAEAYMGQAKAANTKRAYKADWADFSGWCADRGLDSLPAPPFTVGWYLADRADTLKPASLARRLACISQAHRLAGHRLDIQHPAVKDTLAGIRRAKGTRPEGKIPLLVADLKRMVDQLDNSRAGLRDRALLLLGFAGAFRRSELVGLDTTDLEYTNQGLVVTIRKSKTDQTGQGQVKGIPFGQSAGSCPVRAVQNWLTAAGISSGPVFRSIDRHENVRGRLSDRSVALIVKRSAQAVGIDPDRVAGHSLRSGLATSAAAAGVDVLSIMETTGHKRIDTLKKYIRLGNLFKKNAARRVGL